MLLLKIDIKNDIKKLTENWCNYNKVTVKLFNICTKKYVELVEV